MIGFPNLTVLRDGTITAMLFNVPYHCDVVGESIPFSVEIPNGHPDGFYAASLSICS